MQGFEFITVWLSNLDLFYKGVLIIFMILYSIFALMLYIQINSLLTTVNQIKFSPVLRTLAISNLVASIALIIYTIFTISV